jgi:regulator of protease activity HflC (stomatin/prohibitin superfamily)
MKMNKAFGYFFLLLAFLLTSGCTRVESGYVGIKVNLLGSDKGVDVETLGVGRYWEGMNEKIYTFPTFSQNYVWTQDSRSGSENDESIDFQTREGLLVSGDFGISYSIQPDKAAIAFQKWRKGVDEITDIYLRNIVRDAIVTNSANMSVESIYGEGKVALLAKVNEKVAAEVAPFGINIEKIYTVGSFRLPLTVEEAINRKIQATQAAQQRENDVQTAIAQGKIAEAEANARAVSVTIEAKAQAEANKLVGESLSSQLVSYHWVNKWDGKQPVVSGGATPIIGVDSLVKPTAVAPAVAPVTQ